MLYRGIKRAYLMAIIIAVAFAGFNCVFADETNVDYDSIQSSDEKIIGEENSESQLDEEVLLNDGSVVSVKGMDKCGKNLYNPSYAYCADWSIGLVCSKGMDHCGPTCYNESYANCWDRNTGLVCSHGLDGCNGNACYRPYYCTCTKTGVVCD